MDSVYCQRLVYVNLPFTEVFTYHRFAQAISLKQEAGDVLWRCTRNKASLDEEGNPLKAAINNSSEFPKKCKRTRFGLKLNFLMPSNNVVFFCLALSNFVGSSAI